MSTSHLEGQTRHTQIRLYCGGRNRLEKRKTIESAVKQQRKQVRKNTNVNKESNCPC